MYYIIKRQEETPPTYFIGFQVPKFIASKSSDSVIVEFQKDGKPQRKWIKKSDIVLLTDDREYFLKTLSKFKETETKHLQAVNTAKQKLDEAMSDFTQAVKSELDDFNRKKMQEDVPCLLKGL